MFVSFLLLYSIHSIHLSTAYVCYIPAVVQYLFYSSFHCLCLLHSCCCTVFILFLFPLKYMIVTTIIAGTLGKLHYLRDGGGSQRNSIYNSRELHYLRLIFTQHTIWPLLYVQFNLISCFKYPTES